MSVANLRNGDAKFFNDIIVTNVNQQLTFLDLNGKILHQYNYIQASWLDVLEQEKAIIYGNSNHEIGIAKFNSDNQLVSVQIVMKTANLQIDPSIIKVNDSYYAAITEIEGRVNNADAKAENGVYAIHLYRSDNLSNWTLVSDVISEKNNLEDTELFYHNNHFYLVYEKEHLDQGKSELCLIQSTNASGSNWQKPQTLLKADCDHEPAKVLQTENGFDLYYSCDKENPGKSYMGAKIYCAQFDQDFNLLQQDINIPCESGDGVLLYDVRKKENKLQFLFAKDYLSDCDLIVEEGLWE